MSSSHSQSMCASPVSLDVWLGEEKTSLKSRKNEEKSFFRTLHKHNVVPFRRIFDGEQKTRVEINVIEG